MHFVGVDPGKQGAIAVIDAAGTVLLLSPVLLISGGRGEFDVAAIRDLLKGDGRARFVTVEKLQPLPSRMGGSLANFARGVACGFAWMLAVS